MGKVIYRGYLITFPVTTLQVQLLNNGNVFTINKYLMNQFSEIR